MKTPEEVLEQVEDRLRRTWHRVVTGADWAPDFRLGTSGLSGTRLVEAWPQTHRESLRWQEWASHAGEGVELVTRPVSLHRTSQALPATLRVSTVDAAARLVGGDWLARLARARVRRDVLATEFPAHEEPAGMLRDTDSWSDVDFELLCRTAAWFVEHPTSGLTARQVPVEGMGTKWLGARMNVVRRLAGVADLGLVPGRPPRVQVTYLDPTHRASGGRRHDLATVGDVDLLAYQPRLVLISENRDTAQLFPPVDGGIAIEGNETPRSALAELPWIRDADRVWYWGDMDTDGLEILHGFREAGLAVRSLFMDLAAYLRWERYGVDHDHRGKPLAPKPPRELPRLEPGERELYLALCTASWTRHRRIEQERIPLEEAAAVVGADLVAD